MEGLRDRIYNFTFYLFFFLNGTPGNKIHTYRTFTIVSCLLLLFIFGMYCQILYLYRHDMEFYVLVNITPTVSFMLMCALIMCVFYAKRRHNVMVFLLMRDDWQMQKNREEMRIKRMYEERAKTYITFSSLFGISAVTIVLLPSFFPAVLDLVRGANNSQFKYQPFLIDCFIDPDEYYYVLLMIQTLTSYITMSTAVFSINLFVIIVYHVCGMFTVIRHRLKHMEELTDRELAGFIEEHQRVQKFVGLINSTGNEYLCLFLAVTIGTLGISLAEMTKTELIAIRNVSFTLGHMIYFFMSNYLGQKVIDLSTNVSIEAYNTKWYECQARLRKYLLFVILRSSKPCALNTVKLYTFSFEDYAWVMKYAISYCMIVSKVE